MGKELTKKDPLGGEAVEDSKEYKTLIKSVKKFFNKVGLPETEEVEVVNPITKNTAIVTIDRMGTTEQKVVTALSNPNMTREQKDNALSMYLFERGKESSSFLMDLYASKGTHTKETRKFKSEVRFDLTMMANTLAVFFSETKNKIHEEVEKGVSLDDVLMNFADRCESMSEKLIDMVNKTTKDRMRESGYGIYVSKDGIPYSIYDKDFEDVIIKDKKEYDENRFGTTTDSVNVQQDGTGNEECGVL